MKHCICVLFLLLGGCVYQNDLMYTPIQITDEKSTTTDYCLQTYRHSWALFYLLSENHFFMPPTEQKTILPITDCQNAIPKHWYGFDKMN